MSNTTMPTTPTMAPIERSMPRTRMGNACPMARMAANENPDMRFSAFVAVAKRGAITPKTATVATKNRMSAAVAGRSVTESKTGQGRAGRSATRHGPQRRGRLPALRRLN